MGAGVTGSPPRRVALPSWACLPRAVPGDRAHACWRRGRRSGRSGDRVHARWRSRSGSAARPSTTVLRPTVRAISTTDRRMTTRPCNLSRVVTQPRRCARVALLVGPRKTARAPPHFRSRGCPRRCAARCGPRGAPMVHQPVKFTVARYQMQSWIGRSLAQTTGASQSSDAEIVGGGRLLVPPRTRSRAAASTVRSDFGERRSECVGFFMHR